LGVTKALECSWWSKTRVWFIATEKRYKVPNINFDPPHVQEALSAKAIVVEPNASFAKLDIEVSQTGMLETQNLEPQTSDGGAMTSQEPRQPMMVLEFAIDKREMTKMRPSESAEIAGDVKLTPWTPVLEWLLVVVDTDETHFKAFQ